MRRKKCYKCQKYKVPRFFHKNKAQADGYSNTCARCFNFMRREGELKRPSESRRLSYLRNRGNQKDAELKKAYGISLQEFNDLRVKQDFLCAICSKHETESNKGLHTDHCHETKKIRGLLCNSCNLAIGMMKHNITLLSKAIQYLS